MTVAKLLIDMNALTYVVLCKWPDSHYWETIAAFNSERVARQYAKECNTPPRDGWEYRIEPSPLEAKQLEIDELNGRIEMLVDGIEQ